MENIFWLFGAQIKIKEKLDNKDDTLFPFIYENASSPLIPFINRTLLRKILLVVLNTNNFLNICRLLVHLLALERY